MCCNQNVKFLYEFFQFIDQNFIDAQVLSTYGHDAKPYLSHIIHTIPIILNLSNVIVASPVKMFLSTVVVPLFKFITVSMISMRVSIS